MVDACFSALTLCFFGRLSLISPLANFIAIPVITFLVVPLDLLGLLLGAFSSSAQLIAWQAAIYLIDGLNGLLSQLVKLSLSLIHISEPTRPY